MHETSITLALIEQVERSIAGQQVVVEGVNVSLGPLAGVEIEALRACYPLATEGTKLAGSRLEIEELPIQIMCETCTAESSLRELNLQCPKCRSYQVRVTAGREFLLKTIEVRDV